MTISRFNAVDLANRAAEVINELRQVAYAEISPDLTIVSVSDNFHTFVIDVEGSAQGRRLSRALAEFVGTEETLASMLAGQETNFHLERVHREQTDGSTGYLTFHVRPLDENNPGIGLLLIIQDETHSGQIEHHLLQSRNELHLIRQELERINTSLDQRVAERTEELEAAKQEIEKQLHSIQIAHDSTIWGWSYALELRDKETTGHTRRVTEMTINLARLANIEESEIEHIRRGALLHDIGKMAIPDRILHKREKLTDEEWQILRKHPDYAYEMLSSIEYLRPALVIPYCHHEKWDGTGYPRGLEGEKIPLAARLFSVVDVWDALHSDRSYREGWPEPKIQKYLQEQSGKYFDPEIVELFLGSLEKVVLTSNPD